MPRCAQGAEGSQRRCAGPTGAGKSGAAPCGNQNRAGPYCYLNTKLNGMEGRPDGEERAETSQIKPYFTLRLIFTEGFSRSRVRRGPYLDFPNGGLSVNGDGGVPAAPSRGSPTQGGQCGCRQARQPTRPLQSGKSKWDFSPNQDYFSVY